jgi:hypothetical protein
VIMFRLAVQTGLRTATSMNTTTTSTSPSETRMGRDPLIWYCALAYAFSWPLWLVSPLAGGTLGTVFIVIGAFGPMLAAAIIISRTGSSVVEWLRSILRWRVSPVYYAYALGLPVLLAVILNLTLAALGKQPDCILLHASFTPAQDHLLLTADSPLVDVVVLSTYLLGVGVLIALTRGRRTASCTPTGAVAG